MKLNVMIQGQGPNLVLLHGWAFSSQVWQPFLAELSCHWRIHLVDLPGHGQSPAFSGTVDLNRYCNALAHQLPPSAHYLGWSLGGIIATTMAIHHPNRVNKLTLIGSTPQYLSTDSWAYGMDSNLFNSFKKQLNLEPTLTLVKSMALQTRGDSEQQKLKKILAKINNKMPIANLKGLNDGLILLEQCNLRAQLKTISSPCLIIHGHNDTLVPVQAGQYLHDNISDARIHVFDKAGHLPFFHDSASFLTILANFLNE